MNFHKSITPVAVAFSLAANAIMPARAEAQPSAAVAQRTVAICKNFDFSKAVDADDFIGLLSREFACSNSFQSTGNLDYLYQAGVTELALAKYAHLYKRPGRVNPLISQFADPQFYINDSKKILHTLQSRGYSADRSATLAKVIGSTEPFAAQPVVAKIDPSKGTACFLDDTYVGDVNASFSAESKRKMLEGVSVCAAAYNDRPTGILANQYAADLFTAGKYIAVTNPRDRSGLKAAYLAKDFFQRAAQEGVEYTDAMALNQNVIDYYRSRDSASIDQNLNLIGLGIFAVTIAIVASSGAGEAIAFGSAPGVAIQPLGASESAKTAYYLAWRARAAAALAGAAP